MGGMMEEKLRPSIHQELLIYISKYFPKKLLRVLLKRQVCHQSLLFPSLHKQSMDFLKSRLQKLQKKVHYEGLELLKSLHHLKLLIRSLQVLSINLLVQKKLERLGGLVLGSLPQGQARISRSRSLMNHLYLPSPLLVTARLLVHPLYLVLIT